MLRAIISGATGTGKTTLAKRIVSSLTGKFTVIMFVPEYLYERIEKWQIRNIEFWLMTGIPNLTVILFSHKKY